MHFCYFIIIIIILLFLFIFMYLFIQEHCDKACMSKNDKKTVFGLNVELRFFESNARLNTIIMQSL